MNETPDDKKPSIFFAGMEVPFNSVLPGDIYSPKAFFASEDPDPVVDIKTVRYSMDYVFEVDEFDFRDTAYEDAFRNAVIRNFEKEYIGAAISTDTIPAQKSISADDLIEQMKELSAEIFERDKTLIQGFLNAGFRVFVSDVADRPTITLPRSYRDAYHEVMDDRLRRQAN